MNRAAFWALLCLTLVNPACTSSAKRRPIGNRPSGYVQSISQHHFDLHQIESVVLWINGDIFAAMRPHHITQGAKQPERQYAAWDLTYLDVRPVHRALDDDDAALVIDRITPDSPTDRRIMLNPVPQAVNIGGFDHTLVMYKPETAPDSHRWIYYSGAGKVCEGDVSFVIRHRP